jgi:hypothetical protein
MNRRATGAAQSSRSRKKTLGGPAQAIVWDTLSDKGVPGAVSYWMAVRY